MALIRQTASTLLADARSGQLAQVMRRQARFSQISPGVSEVASWAASLKPFLEEVVDAGLGHVEVLLEHKLPFSPKRPDAILCGIHPRTGRPSYVVVELKQWTEVLEVDADRVRVRNVPYDVLHPVEQVRRYCQYLIDLTPILADDPDSVSGVTYLHNAVESGIWKLRQYHMDEHGRLFSTDTKAQFVAHLRARLSTAPQSRDAARLAADRLLTAVHKPAKPLMRVVARELAERQQFVLLDEQQVAFSKVMAAVESARVSRRQTVVIVIGGPGSGKSVIALSLLGELSRRGYGAMHATGSKAFTKTLRTIVGRRSEKTFVYFNSFMKAGNRDLAVLICDEAHRLRENSVDRWTRKEIRQQAKPQVEELIDAAYVPVFLLDEHQVVRPGEMGTVAEIQSAALRLGCKVEIVSLDGQYRCGGSAFYDEWVARLLGIAPEPVSWSDMVSVGADTFLVTSAYSPQELESWIVTRDHGRETARMAAGYCWRWSDPRAGADGRRSLVNDVVIGDWSRPWNAKPDAKVDGVPVAELWATDPGGIGQVGCVYTAQGFEYDWAGIIFGGDFVRRNGSWQARPEHSRDPAITRSLSPERAHALIRNTYKVLLTRGMRGVCLYSTDPETHEFLAAMAK